MKKASKNEFIIARFLSLSMWLSTTIVLVGILVLFALKGGTIVDLGHFQTLRPEASLASGHALAALEGFKPRVVILVGLILLMLTPVARVALTMVLFAREKDFVYVAISGTVLAIVVVALIGA